MSTIANGAPAPRMATAMALLARGVPLSLLFDLVLGPRSRELLDVERLTADVPLQRVSPDAQVKLQVAG